jgi:acetamidase/formamidase
MATRGDRDHATGGGGRSFHAVRPDAFNYGWDNSIEPELEIDSGEVVEFRVRDASDEQLRANSTSEDVAKLDFDHVNPVSGPVYVRDARPGDVLAVEILEFRPREWGWTALIPGFGLLADEFPEPWLRISRVEAERGRVIFTEGIELPQYHVPPGTLPRAEGTGYHVSTGVAPDLMEATKQAVRATIEHLGEGRGISREEAYALCSVAVDLRIHEVVDAPNWVVGAFLPDDIFTGGGNR